MASDILFDVEVPFSKAVVIFGGVNYGKVKDQSFIDKSLGLGFRGEVADLGLRLDVCYNIQQVAFTTVYALQSGGWIWNSTTTEGNYAQGKLNSEDTGIGLTLNTLKGSWLLNPFIHGYYDSQKIIQPKISDPPSYRVDYFNLAAAVFFNVSTHNRLLLGFGLNNHDRWLF
ncbi:MAG: hypothetical protein E4H13_03175 [Calditrichales bacterium]|nr:MAG: hypothetical protein E4H13_03175 [Calditrichales bacterium]